MEYMHIKAAADKATAAWLENDTPETYAAMVAADDARIAAEAAGLNIIKMRPELVDGMMERSVFGASDRARAESTTATQIVELRKHIAKLTARNDCECDHRPRVCESCRRLIRLNDVLRDLEREPEGQALLARELAEFRNRPKKPLAAIYADMNDPIPF